MNKKLRILLIIGAMALIAAGCNKTSAPAPGKSNPPTAQSNSVTTDPATNITNSSAVLNGSYFGAAPVANTWFVYDTDMSQVIAGNGTIVDKLPQAGIMNFNLTGLTAGTTYYFRVVGGNPGAGPTGMGNVLNFTTLSGPPAPITKPASNITLASATLNGTFSGSPTSTWFVYGTDHNQVAYHGNGATNSVTSPVTQSSPTGTMSFNLTGLTAGTTYYFQAAAANSGGTAYSGIGNFTLKPSITTNPATNIANNTATLNGTFTSKTIYTSFQYGTTSNQVSSGSGTSVGSASQSSASGTLSFNLTGLAAGTTYYFRTVSSNNGGSAFGSVASFTTTNAATPIKGR